MAVIYHHLHFLLNKIIYSTYYFLPFPVLSSGLEGELLGMGVWSLGLGAVGAAIVGIFFANTDLCLSKVAQASMDYLEDADLQSTAEDGGVIKAKSLWEASGAVVMAVRRPG
uniref:Peroxiredoxin-like 2 activated in M-CSF stimulated monocytes n=1 Tax=Gadus morhua TaxID=8049 RepID=A0A8C4Z4R6_GADMO